MRLGFYLDTCGGTPRNTEIYNFLNSNVGKLEDAAVFFENVDFNPVQTKFGMFDAADLWGFRGNLVCTSINSLRSAVDVKNDLKLAYLFDSSQVNERTIIELMRIAMSNIKVLVTDERDRAEFKRLTGVEPKSLDGLNLEKLEGVFNEEL